MYRAVGFDWSGVLCGPTGEAFDKSMSTILNAGLEEYDIVYKRYNRDFNEGRINGETLWTKVASDFGKTDKISEMLELQATRDSFELSPEVLNIIQALGDTGLKLGLLTNNTLENGREIKSLPIASLFDVIHISAETGQSKPDKTAFELFIKDLAVEPAELVFIDDDVKNIAIVQNCGATAIKFDTADQCKNDLHSLGLI